MKPSAKPWSPTPAGASPRWETSGAPGRGKPAEAGPPEEAPGTVKKQRLKGPCGRLHPQKAKRGCHNRGSPFSHCEQDPSSTSHSWPELGAKATGNAPPCGSCSCGRAGSFPPKRASSVESRQVSPLAPGICSVPAAGASPRQTRHTSRWPPPRRSQAYRQAGPGSQASQRKPSRL